MHAAMFAKAASVLADDLSRFIRNAGAEKVAHFHLPDEADALAVFFGRRAEAQRPGTAADIGLQHFADGKEGVAGLVLLHQREEVGLVLILIQPAQDAAVVRFMPDAGIMTCRNGIEPLIPRS